MRYFPDHVTEHLRRLGVDPALLEPGKVDAQEWGSRESGRRWRVIGGAITPTGGDAPTRRWYVGRLVDGRGVIALSAGDDPKGADKDTYAVVLSPGGRPAPEDIANFERLSPGAGRELQYAVADLSRMVEVKIPAIGAVAAEAWGDLPAGAGRIDLMTDRPTILVLWGPPMAGEKCELVAPEVLRLALDRGWRDIDIPDGAVWGGLYDPSRDPPLLIGVFHVTGGVQRLYTVLWFPDPGTKLRLYLGGAGILEPLSPAKFDRITNAMRAAGLRWDPGLPYAPPFQLWWAYIDRIACTTGAGESGRPLSAGEDTNANARAQPRQSAAPGPPAAPAGGRPGQSTLDSWLGGGG